MSKILCIPDLHGRKFWRKTLFNNVDKVDKIIFLGDYLDPYPEEIMMAPELMECNNFYDSENLLKMLEDIVSLKKNEPNKFILLTGNHTDSYIWSKFKAASRTDYDSWEIYHKFFLENLSLFNLVYTQDNVIFSHAGISQGWTERVWKKLEYPADGLISVMEIAIMLRDTPLNEFTNDYINIISDISHYRYGDMFYGSCEWADLREHIDKVIDPQNNKFIGKGEDGIFQVFGHTQLKDKLVCDKWACLDCRKAFIVDTLTHTIDGSDSSL